MVDILDFLRNIGFTKEASLPVLCSTFIIIIFLVLAYHRIDKKIIKGINPIRNAIIEIQTIFTGHKIPLNHHLTERAGSPLQPTEYGLELIKDSGLYEIINNNKEKFIKEINEKLKKLRSKTDYDIQECSRQVLLDNKNNKIMIPVKAYAFENAVDIDIILLAGGLILRDLYLNKKN